MSPETQWLLLKLWAIMCLFGPYAIIGIWLQVDKALAAIQQPDNIASIGFAR